MKKYIIPVYLIALCIVCLFADVVKCTENSTKIETVEKSETPDTVANLATAAPEVVFNGSVISSGQNQQPRRPATKKRGPTLRRRFLPYRFKSRRYYDWHNYIGAQNAYDVPRYQHLPPQPQPFPAAPPGPAPGYPAPEQYNYPAGYPNQQTGYQDTDYYGVRNPGFDNNYARRPLPPRRFRLRRPLRPTDSVPQLNYLEKVSKPGGGFEYRQVKLVHDDKGNVFYSRQGETENGTIVLRRERKYFKPRTYPYYPEPAQDHRYQQQPQQQDPYYQGYPRSGYPYPAEPQPQSQGYPQQPYPQPQPAYQQPQPQPAYGFQQPYGPHPPPPYPPQPQPYPPQPQPYPPQPQPPPQAQPYPQPQPYPPQPQPFPRVPRFPLGGYVHKEKPNYGEGTRTATLNFAKPRGDQKSETGNEIPSTVRTL